MMGLRAASVGLWLWVLTNPAAAEGARSRPEASAPRSDARDAVATASPKVVIVRGQNDEPIFARLRGEMLAWKWQVVSTPRAEVQDPMELEAVAREYAAAAAIRVRPDSGEIEIWVGQPGSSTTAVHETLTIEDTRVADLLAFRAAETLRARLVKLGLARSPDELAPDRDRVHPVPRPAPETRDSYPRERAFADPSAEPSPSGREPVVWFDAALGVLSRSNEAAGVVGTRLGVAVRPTRTWSVSAYTLLPLSSTVVHATEGSADVSVYLVGIGADWTFDAEPFRLSLGPSIAGVLLATRGQASPPLAAGSDSATTLALAGLATVGCRVSRRLGLRTDLLFGSTLEPLAIHFAEREVAVWGRPTLAATLGLEVGL